ncbi:MAG: MFS transporter [Dehalococcoidia bacterium]|nr:MFS transporter [Dehalococcoidia bacterium]
MSDRLVQLGSVQKAPILLPKGMYYGWVIVWVSWLANMVTSTMNPVVFSIFIDPMRHDLGVGLSTLAWAVTIRQISGGIAAPFVGRLVDAFGARWMGLFGAALAGATLVSLYFVHNVWVMYLLYGLSGLGGFGTFGGNLLTTVPAANWFIAKRGRATSIAGTGVGVGTALGVPIAQLLVHTVGWRWAWVVFGIAIWVVIIPAYGFLMRRRPEDLGLYPDGASSPYGAASGGRDGGTARPGATEVNWTLAEALRTPVFWFILLSLTAYMFSSSAVLFLRVPFWNKLDVSTVTIAFGMAADPFTVIFAMLLFGLLAERFAVRYMAVVGGIWRGISMLPLMMGGSSVLYVFAHNITWGIGSGGNAAAQNLVIPTYFGRLAQGAIRGFSAPLMIGAGALGAPVVGYMMDADMNVNLIWAISGCMMLFSGLAFLFLKPPSLSKKQRAPVAEKASAPADR